LDKGHKIHQVSDEIKRNVDPKVLANAKAMGKAALGCFCFFVFWCLYVVENKPLTLDFISSTIEGN
jgi:hypothetical protein